MCVCIHVCAHVFLCDTAEFLSPSHTHTHKRTHSHTRACPEGAGLWQVRRFGFEPSSLCLPSSELALAQGQAATSICLVNTEISKAHPSPRQKIAQASQASAKIARSAW